MLGNIIFNLRLKWIKRQGEQYRREKKIKDAYVEYWPEKKKHKVSNIVLAISICTIIIYTIASFWIVYMRGIPMDSTLTTCVYSFFGGELFLLAGLRTGKMIKGYTNENVKNDDNTVG